MQKEQNTKGVKELFSFLDGKEMITNKSRALNNLTRVVIASKLTQCPEKELSASPFEYESFFGRKI